MKRHLLLSLVLMAATFVYGQSFNVMRAIQNNEVDLKKVKNQVLLENTNFYKKNKNTFSNIPKTTFSCDTGNEMIVERNDSLYTYNFDSETLSPIAAVVQGGAAAFGYLSNPNPRIISAANWDSIYYFENGNWTFSNFEASGEADLFHTGSGEELTYFMGEDLWYFKGTSDPIKIRSNINYTVADLVVDERDHAWVITGENWPLADTLRIIDSTGMSICDIPFEEPVNTINGYGMLIREGQVMVAFGGSNEAFLYSLVPLEIENGVVRFGERMFLNPQFGVDLASCSKEIAPCNVLLPTTQAAPTNTKIYPNPFETHLNLDIGNKQQTTIEIYNAIGQLQYENTIYTNELIPTTTWANGIYFIKIDKNEAFRVCKY